MLRWSRKEVEAATETPCLKLYSKFKDRLTIQAEAGILRNRKVLRSSKSRGRQPTEQCMPAPLKNTVSSRTYKLLFLLTSTSQNQKKTKAKQSNKNFILKLQSWQRAFPSAVPWSLLYKGISWSLTEKSFTLHTQIITKCRSGIAQSQQLISFPLTFNLSDFGRINLLGSSSFWSPLHHCQYLITSPIRTSIFLGNNIEKCNVSPTFVIAQILGKKEKVTNWSKFLLKNFI